MAYLSHAGQNTGISDAEKLDFVVSMTNLTWPAIAAISGGFQTLTGVGMRTSQQLNANFTQSQGAILAAGGVASLALFDMTQKAMEFNREMALVKGLIGDISNREMAQLSASARKLAVDFGEAPANIARGFQMIARAGINNSADQIRVLTNGMRLAKVEGMDVADAVKEVITATTLFGDSYTNVERYASAIAHAANISVTSAKQIGEALKYVGGGAKEHWSIEETLAAIATLSQKGVEGSTAGISIRSFMVYILREMPKSQKALRQLGMTFDDFWEKASNGQRIRLKPLQEIIQTMSEAMYSKGLGRGDMMRVLAQFGEPRMMQQYMKLFPTQEEMQNGTWLLSQFNSEMQNTYDMQERLQNVLNSTQEKWNQMTSAIQNAEIAIAEGTLPVLSVTTDVVKGLSMALANNKVAAAGLAAGLTTVALAAGILVLAWGKGAAIHLFSNAIGKVKTQLGALTGTIQTVNKVTKESSFSIMAKDMQKLERQGKALSGLFAKGEEGIFGKYTPDPDAEKAMQSYGMTMTPGVERVMAQRVLGIRETLHEKGAVTPGMALEEAYGRAEFALEKNMKDSPISKARDEVLGIDRELRDLTKATEELNDTVYRPGKLNIESMSRSSSARVAEMQRGNIMDYLKIPESESSTLHDRIMKMKPEEYVTIEDEGVRRGIDAWRDTFAQSRNSVPWRMAQNYLKATGTMHENEYKMGAKRESLAGAEIEYRNMEVELQKRTRGYIPSDIDPDKVKAMQKDIKGQIHSLSANLTAVTKLREEQASGMGVFASKIDGALKVGKVQEYQDVLSGRTYDRFKTIMLNTEHTAETGAKVQKVLDQEELALTNALTEQIQMLDNLEMAYTKDKKFRYTFKDKIKDSLNRWGKIENYIPQTKDLTIGKIFAASQKGALAVKQHDTRYFNNLVNSAKARTVTPITSRIAGRFGGPLKESRLKEMDGFVDKAQQRLDGLKKQQEDFVHLIDIFDSQNQRLQTKLDSLDIAGAKKALDTNMGGARNIRNLIKNKKSTIANAEKRFHGNIMSPKEFEEYHKTLGFRQDKVDFLKDVQANREFFFRQLMEETESGNIDPYAEGALEKYAEVHEERIMAQQQKRLDQKIKEIMAETKHELQYVEPGSQYEKILKDIEDVRIKNLEKFMGPHSVKSTLFRGRMMENIKRGFMQNRKKFEAFTRVDGAGKGIDESDYAELEEMVLGTGFTDKYHKMKPFQINKGEKKIRRKDFDSDEAYRKAKQGRFETKEFDTLEDAINDAEERLDAFMKRNDKNYQKMKNRKDADRKIKKSEEELFKLEERLLKNETEGAALNARYNLLLKKRETLRSRLESSDITKKEYESQLRDVEADLNSAERSLNIAKNRKKQLAAKMEKLNKEVSIKDIPNIMKKYIDAQYDAITQSEKMQDTFGKRLPEGYFAKLKKRISDRLKRNEEEQKAEEEVRKKKTISQLREEAAEKRLADRQSLSFGILKMRARLFGRNSALFRGNAHYDLSQEGLFPSIGRRIRAGATSSRDKFFDRYLSPERSQIAKSFISMDFLRDLKKNTLGQNFELAKNIPLLGSFASFLGISVGALPVFGLAIAALGLALFGIVAWWTKWNQSMEIATKKLDNYKKQQSALEQQEDQLLNKRKGMKKDTPEYKTITEELGKTRGDLNVVYDRMAGVNRQIFELRSSNWMQYSPIIRKEQGPSWYGGNALDKATKALNPASWVSGEMISRLSGAETPTKNAWLTGPREQMMAEAYQVEEQRSQRLKALNSSQESQMAMLEQQYSRGSIDKATYEKQKQKGFETYADKATKLNRSFDRQLAPIVGPSNVEATKQLYMAEQQAKTQRLLLANAAFKLVGAIFALISAITLPLRLLGIGGDGAYEPTAEEGQQPGEQNISTSITDMVSEMQKSIDKIEEVKVAINDMANGILYQLYKANYTIDLIPGLLDYLTSPSKWINSEVKAPRFGAETWETWLAKNKLGMEHRKPYYPGGEMADRDEARKKKLKEGTIDPATLLAQGEITPEQAKKIYEENKKKKEKLMGKSDVSLGMPLPTDKDGKIKTAWGGQLESPVTDATPQGLPAQKVDTGIGGAGPEYNDTVGTPQVAGTTGVKPSDTASQMGSTLGAAAGMALPPGLDVLGGAVKDRTTQTDVPSELTDVPDVVTGVMPGEPKGEGTWNEKPTGKTPFDEKMPDLFPGKFKQKTKEKSIWETIEEIFKVVADATGISWVWGKISGLINTADKTDAEKLEEEKTHLRFQSPVKITKGFSGYVGAGAQSFVFPQLDPDLFRKKAVQTGKEFVAKSAKDMYKRGAPNAGDVGKYASGKENIKNIITNIGSPKQAVVSATNAAGAGPAKVIESATSTGDKQEELLKQILEELRSQAGAGEQQGRLGQAADLIGNVGDIAGNILGKVQQSQGYKTARGYKRQAEEAVGIKPGVRARMGVFATGEVERAKRATGEFVYGKTVNTPTGSTNAKAGGILGIGGYKERGHDFLTNENNQTRRKIVRSDEYGALRTAKREMQAELGIDPNLRKRAMVGARGAIPGAKSKANEALFGKTVSLPGGQATDAKVGGLFGVGGVREKSFDFAKNFATSKEFRKDAIHGKQIKTPGGETLPGGATALGDRMGGLLGKGGIKDKVDKGILGGIEKVKGLSKADEPDDLFGGKKGDSGIYGRKTPDAGEVGKTDTGTGYTKRGGKARREGKKFEKRFGDLGSSISDKFSGVGGRISAAGEGTPFSGITDMLGSTTEGIGGIGEGIASGFGKKGGKIGKGIGKMADKLGGKSKGITKALGKMGGGLGKVGKMGGKLGGLSKGLGKGLGKAGKLAKIGKSALKKIPFLGSIVSGADLVGGLLSGTATPGEILGNVAGLIPGVGTIGSLAGDVAGAGLDAALGGGSVGELAGAAVGDAGAGASGATGALKKGANAAAASGGSVAQGLLQGINSLVSGQSTQTGEIKGQRKDQKKGFGLGMGDVSPMGIMGKAWDMLSPKGEKFRFKKHSPFTVWRGQSGSLPGGSGGSFSVRFPELDSEKFKKMAVETGQQLAGQGSGVNVTLQPGAITIVSSDAEEIQQLVYNAIVKAARDIKVGS